MAIAETRLISESPAETQALARRLGARLPAGTVLAVSGDLGVGKTLFAQGLAEGLGVAEAVDSPTYIYYQAYQGRLPFYHLDAYRLDGWEEAEIAEIGLEECFRREAVAFVEWAELISAFLPADPIRLIIRREPASETRRLLIFQFEPAEQAWLAAWLAAELAEEAERKW